MRGEVIGHEVHEHAEAQPVRVVDQLVEVGLGPIIAADPEVVRHVVAEVPRRGAVERREPERGDPQVLQVRELSVDRAEAVVAE